MTIHDLIRRRLIERAGLLERVDLPSLDELARSEWSPEFERLMRNRLIMGAIRYGRIGAKGKPQYDRIRSITRRLKSYQSTGNKEALVDAANLCLLEFVECRHPNSHFHSTDDTNERVAVIGGRP